MENPKIIKLSPSNIDNEHICCAFSDKKCKSGYQSKKEWLSKQFPNGYVFRKLDVRGKVFIEYVPIEHGWVPINAHNYMLINCFWVSGKYKANGHGDALYQQCLKDTTAKKLDGIVVVAGDDKKPFMSDKEFFRKKGFLLSDIAEPYFELWYKPLKKTSQIPQFKDVAKNGTCDVKNGLSVYYSNACPYTEHYANTELANIANNRNIPLVINKIDTKYKAHNHFVPHTIYSIFYNGKFVTHQILTEKSFDRFLKIN